MKSFAISVSDRKKQWHFGDGGNDISMLRHAAIGVAMGNAQEPVKKVADYITFSNEEDGVAVVVDKFFTKAPRRGRQQFKHRN